MNILKTTGGVLGQSAVSIWDSIANYLPIVIIAFILVVIGFIIGNILGRAVTHVINLLKIDKALAATGLKSTLDQVGVNFSVSRSIGGLVRWSIILAFVLSASSILGLIGLSAFIITILAYIPTVIIAAFILVVTFLLADFVSKLVSGSARAAGMPSSAAAAISRYSIIVVGVMAALAQLNIASGFMEILFTGIVAAISIALGLAFGLGGKDVAGRMLDKMESNWK